MHPRTVSIPELGLIAGTRAALGAGIGLLIADRMTREHREAVGWTLVAVGVLTTFPLAAEVLFRANEPTEEHKPRQSQAKPRIRQSVPQL